MQNFPGKIGFPGDESSDVQAVMTVSDMRLEITTGDTSIGDWPLSGVNLELGARGYIVTLDGEQMILAPHDRFGFQHAIEQAQQALSQGVSRRQARKAAKSAKAAAHQPEVPKPEPDEASPKTAKHKKPRRLKQPRRTKKPVAQVGEPAKPAPHVPGLEDPDKDALWATHRTREPTSLRERLNTGPGARKLVLAGSAAFLVLAFLAPAVVSFMLLIPGVVAVVLAGLSLLDPSYTRLLPPSMSEIRLMMIGLGFFGASLLIATIF